MSNALIALALVLAVVSLGISLLAIRSAPRRMIHDALLELADQRAMLEKLLTRNHSAARAENVSKARDARAEKRTLTEEAQAILDAAPAQGTLPAVPMLRQVNKGTEEQQLIELRKRAGIL